MENRSREESTIIEPVAGGDGSKYLPLIPRERAHHYSKDQTHYFLFHATRQHFY